MSPVSLQVHCPRALCGPSAAILHQNLRQVQEEHRGWYSPISARIKKKINKSKSDQSLCLSVCLTDWLTPSSHLPTPGSSHSAGHASLLGGGELPHQVRQVPQNRQVLPGPDWAPLRVVSNHGEQPSASSLYSYWVPFQRLRRSTSACRVSAAPIYTQEEKWKKEKVFLVCSCLLWKKKNTKNLSLQKWKCWVGHKNKCILGLLGMTENYQQPER